MKKSQINVEIEPGLRERVKVRAAQESRSLREIVESGLKLYLSSPVMRTGSVGGVTGGAAAPAAERGVLGPCEGCGANARLLFTSDDVGLCAECFAAVPVIGPRPVDPLRGDGNFAREVVKGGKPTKAELQALIDAVPAERSRATDPSGLSESRSVLADRQDAERRRRAAQDRLRTAPEDESQDPDDQTGPGF